ncbi:MAG: transposase [Intrasporangium sp.]|uniref:Tn3 family transposase n=1 Tax=Intrasporangium sp. TaxID=1925024 RepID=UPI002649A3FD|nr:Tn3 family transposase [Intrasporangium sp.]MDN5794525.1 transposase [Intrasporangium sp.]
MLVIYGYGTNTGIRAVAAGHGHTHSEEQLRYARRRYLTREAAEQIAIGIANATFAARRRSLWGAGSPRSPPTPPISAPGTRTSSPSGTPVTAAAVF